MKILIVDASLAEFGWELMSWQGFVRREATGYDQVVVCTTAGREALYSDFTNQFLVHNVPLVRDCFEQRKIYDKPAWEAYRMKINKRIKALKAAGHEITILTAKKYISTDEQTFVKYGKAERAIARGDIFDIIVHARNKESHNPYYQIYNWPIERWNKVVEALCEHKLTVAAIGTKNDALLPIGAVDMRGIDLCRLTDMLAASRLVVGPSSGPMHLASLCGVPRFVWASKQWSSAIGAYDRERYMQKWNPFRTTCKVIDDDPNVQPDIVIAGVLNMLTELTDEARPSKSPVDAIAGKMIEYWKNRAAQQGRDYVSRQQKNTKAQTRIVGDQLKLLLDSKQFHWGLDFGSGWGRFTEVIAKYCATVTAVDLVDNFRDDLPAHVQFQHITFPTKINLPNATVDLFVAILVLQHITDDTWLEEVTTEIKRVLMDSATVIIIDDKGKPAGHVRQRTADEFRRLLDLGQYKDEPFNLDGADSHHIIVGSHRKAMP
jgi:hypothetical protein